MPWEFNIVWANLRERLINEISISFPFTHRAVVEYPFVESIPRLTLQLNLGPNPVTSMELVERIRRYDEATEKRLRGRISSNFPTFVAANGFHAPIRPTLHHSPEVQKQSPLWLYLPLQLRGEAERYFQLTPADPFDGTTSWMILDNINLNFRRRRLDKNLVECLERP